MEKKRISIAAVMLFFTMLWLGAQVRTESISIAPFSTSNPIEWHFELNAQTKTATIIAPAEGAYSFANPGKASKESSEGSSYNFWSPSITGMNGEASTFTAIKVPETVVSAVDGITYTVTAVGNRALAQSNIAFIHLPNTVETIGDEAFADCASLVGIEYVSAYELVPHSVTSLGKGAFKGCSSLKRIDIGDGVTQILPETFDGCNSLQYIKIGASVAKIDCQLPALEGIAFHSPTPPTLTYQLSAKEIWAPIDHLEAYKTKFGTVHGFGITPEQENELVIYRNQPRAVGFEITSAPMLREAPDIMYYFVYNALTFDVSIGGFKPTTKIHAQADAATKDIKDLPYIAYFSDPTVAHTYDTNVSPMSSDSHLQVNYSRTGEYELTVVSNDFTRASYKWKVKVVEGTPVTQMFVTGPLVLATGSTGQCKIVWNGTKSIPSVTDVIWSSDNESVFTVDENGLITAVGEGSGYVTARSLDPGSPGQFAIFPITVSNTGLFSATVPQSVATNTNVNLPSNIKPHDISTDFYAGLINEDNSIGVLYAPSAILNESGNLPETPYTFPYTGAESLTVRGIKLMTTPDLEQLMASNYYYADTYEAYQTPLIVPCVMNRMWDGSVQFVEIVKIGDFAFAGSNIEYAHLASYGTLGASKTTELGNYVFAECHSYKGIPEGSAYDVVPDRITKMGRGVFKNCDKMEIMMIGDGITELPEETFDGCTALRQVRLGAGIKTINCSVSASEVIVVASPEVPAIAPGCTLTAPVIMVPAASLDRYKAAWSWAKLQPYGIKIDNGRTGIGAYIYQSRKFDIEVNGYDTEGASDYSYPYVTSTTDITYSLATTKKPFYRVEYDQSAVSAFKPENDAATVTFNDVKSPVNLTYISTDITRSKLTVPIALKSGTPVTKIAINSVESVKVGKSCQLTLTYSPANPTDKQVIWEVLDTDLAKIDASGKLTALKKGSCAVIATTKDPYSNIYTALKIVEISDAVTNIDLTYSDGTIVSEDTIVCEIDTKISFDVTISPKGLYAQNIKWSFDVESDTIASFDLSTKTITTLGAGVCTLKVTMPKDYTVSGKDIVRTVVIKVKPPYIEPVEPIEPDPVDPGEPDDPNPEEPENPDPVDPDNPDPEKPTEPEPTEPEDPDPVVPETPDPEQPEEPDPVDPEEPDPIVPEEPDPEDPEDDPMPEVPTGIDGVSGDEIKLSTNGLTITIEGIESGTLVRLYTIDGQLVRTHKAVITPFTLTAPRPGIYILLTPAPHKLSLH